jgi:S1-C subfamily serine protease
MGDLNVESVYRVCCVRKGHLLSKSESWFSSTLFKFAVFPPMKRLLVFIYATLLLVPVLQAQETTPARPPMEQQVPRGPQAPGPGRSSPPAQEAIPIPVPMAPPKPNGPVQKSLVRITATSLDPDYKAPWNAGGLERGVGAGFVISGNRIMTNAHVVANSRYVTVERDGDPNKYPAKVQFIANDCDLAVITVSAPDFFKNMLALKLGEIPALESTVSAYGYPIGGERMSVTTGIVSRIDFQLYTHSSVDQHLAIQISAQINPGNSGGPVMQDGKVVGVAFQGYSGDVAQGVAYMIPTPVIKRFLQDISNGHYDEYPDLAITYAKLQNPAQRRFLGLKDDDHGVLVSSVVAAGPSDGILYPGDVLLAIDGHPIASDANVEMEGERAQFEEVVERKFKGDSVKMDILRNKRPMTVELKLYKPWPYSVQGHSYDVRPRYVLYGGLLFQPLSLDMLEAYRTADLRVRHFFEYFVLDQLYLQHPDVIVLANILPDPMNTYLSPYRGGIVDEVNGKKIRTLDELASAFAESPERLVIRMIGDGPPLVLNRSQVEAARERIKTRYNVLKEQNLEEQPEAKGTEQAKKT